MAGFRLFHRLRNRRSVEEKPPAALPTSLTYPRGHVIKREILSAVCSGSVRVMRLHRSGHAQIVSMTYDAWLAHASAAVSAERAEAICVPSPVPLQAVGADAPADTVALDGA
jgi:hypothetical protein